MMRQARYALAGALLWGAGVVTAHADAPATAPTTPAAPLVQTDFEADTGGWAAIGTGAKAAVTQDAANVHAGKGALKFDYTIAKGQFSTLILPTPDAKLAHAGAFRFWVKADRTTPLAVMLSEKGGGHYIAPFAAPAGQWQSVRLTPSDFVLGEGPNDPKDPDNKLDLDQVEAIGLLDLGQMFAQAAGTPVADLLSAPTGAHTLLLDDFTVEAAPATSATGTTPPTPPGTVTIDDFSTPQLNWVAVGGVTLSRDAVGPALVATYQQAPGKLAVLFHPFSAGRLTGKTKIAFSVSTAKSVALLVQLEERGGGKYNTLMTLKGGPTAQPQSLPVADFEPADDSHDANGHLDMDQVHQIGFIDLSGMVPGGADGSQENTLKIGPITAQ